MTALLSMENVGKHYLTRGATIEALSNISMHVEEKEFVSIIGPCGCGKSTLLRIVAGLDKPTKGTIRLRDEEIVQPHPKIGMVFQSAALFPWRNVIQNIEFGLETQKTEKKIRRITAQKLIDLMGLKGYEHAYPPALSGGMQQLVGIARALAVDPDIVIMDEPFSALDEFTAERLRTEVMKLWENTGKTFLLVTHNLEEAVQLADRIIVLSARPGKVKNIIEVNLNRPRSRTDKRFSKVQHILFEMLREELQYTLTHHILRHVHASIKIEDIEQSYET